MNIQNQAGREFGKACAPLRVLLVDDDPVCREVGCALLSLWGIEPVLACNGSEAFELVREREFDIVLMDVAMPVMDGLAATDKIRRFEQENPSKAHVPIVAYTSRAMPLSASECLRVGLSEVLKKPSDADSMSKCLSQWCGSKFSPARVF
jgi:CheY-like chemotaxis protein